MKKAVWFIIGILLVTGTGVTVADYRSWQKAETAKYGQGWNDLKKPALGLTLMYQNDAAGVRMRLPGEWKVTENPVFMRGNIRKGADPVTVQPQKVAEINGLMTVKISYSVGNLTDIVAGEVKKITAAGFRLSRDWEYVNTEKINLTVITWQETDANGNVFVKQRAMAKKGNKLLEIDSAAGFENWDVWENTILAVYRSTEMF